MLMNNKIMTKYEYTRIRGIRIQQLIDGMKPFVDCPANTSYEEIVDKELRERKLPLMITRPDGFNKFIDIPVSEMNVERYISSDGKQL
jgi:DNA-directed RNA polymerase subunit K/omega